MVILVSTLFAGASVATYGEFAKFESAAEASVSFSDLLTLASEAMENGTTTSTLFIPASTISCTGGVLSMTTTGSVQTQRIATDCAFQVEVSRGTHTVILTEASGLSMKVS